MLLPPERQRSFFDYEILAAFLAGTTSGALLTALVVWLLSGFVEPLSVGPRVVLLMIGAAFIWLCKHSRLKSRIALPESRRQIPAEVFGGSLTQGAYRFGLELGTGVRTYVPSSAPYILLLALFLAQVTLSNAVLVGVGFGVGRAVPLAFQLLAARQVQTTTSFLRRADNLASATASLFILVGALILV